MDRKSEKIRNFGPKSFPGPILGLARQSVRTRLRLWSLSVLDFGLARFVPREGAADSERERAFRRAMFLYLWVCGVVGLGDVGLRV